MSLGFVASHGGDALEFCAKVGFPVDSVLDFSLNVNPYGPPDSVVASILSCIKLIKFYPERFYLKLREAISEYVGVSPEEVVVGCGVTELIHSILVRFVKNGPVIIPLPTFTEYEAAAKGVGFNVEFVDPVGLDVDLEKTASLLKGASGGCLILCNPNNPTGWLLDYRFLSQLFALAERRGVTVLLDEAYIDLSEGGRSLAQDAVRYENVFVLRSLTKPFGFPGLRVGYAVCSRRSAREFEATAISWRVGVLEEAAAIAALRDTLFLEDSKAKIFSEKRRLVEGINSISGLRAIRSDTNFLMVDLSRSHFSPKNLRWRLLSYGVVVRELSSVRGINGPYIRVCVRKPDENKFLLEALRNIIYSMEKVYPNNPSCDKRGCHTSSSIDCRLCFCPFYPCLDTATGGSFVKREGGGLVWNCSRCEWVHRSEVADLVLEQLSGVDLRSSDPEDLLSARKRVLGVLPP
jgi:threonine-phosphate decarboxylase